MMALGTCWLLNGGSGPCPTASPWSLFHLDIAANQLSILPQLAASAWTSVRLQRMEKSPSPPFLLPRAVQRFCLGES